MTDDTEELEWPDRMYLLHPSVKTFGGMITTPERKEYVRADRIEALVRERDEAKAMQACGCAYDTPTDICMGHLALFERVYAMRQGKP